jgi:hypothetical protein
VLKPTQTTQQQQKSNTEMCPLFCCWARKRAVKTGTKVAQQQAQKQAVKRAQPGYGSGGASYPPMQQQSRGGPQYSGQPYQQYSGQPVDPTAQSIGNAAGMAVRYG